MEGFLAMEYQIKEMPIHKTAQLLLYNPVKCTTYSYVVWKVSKVSTKPTISWEPL